MPVTSPLTSASSSSCCCCCSFLRRCAMRWSICCSMASACRDTLLNRAHMSLALAVDAVVNESGLLALLVLAGSSVTSSAAGGGGVDTVAVAFLLPVRVCLATAVNDVTDVPLALAAAVTTPVASLVALLLLLPAPPTMTLDSFFGRPRFFFDGVVWSSDAVTDPITCPFTPPAATDRCVVLPVSAAAAGTTSMESSSSLNTTGLLLADGGLRRPPPPPGSARVTS